MKIILNVFLFFLSVALIMISVSVIYYLVGLVASWVVSLKMIWLIIVGMFSFSFIIGLGSYTSAFVANLIRKISPYKKASSIAGAIFVILFGIANLFLVWKIADLESSRQLIAAIMASILIFYISVSFIIGLLGFMYENN